MSRYIISYQLKDHGKFESYINSRQRSADAHHTNAFKFCFFKFCLVFKRKIKTYKCSKQVYLISNLKKKKISALDICCMWGEVCLCLLIEKSTNHFSCKKKWTVIFQGKCYWSKFFFCMVHCFGQCHNVQWYEMHKMCNFSKSHWSFANIWGVFPFKKMCNK